MSTKNWVMAIVEAVLWYLFIYYLLWSVKNDVSVAQSALILLALAYAASISCPWFRNSGGWLRLWKKDQRE